MKQNAWIFTILVIVSCVSAYPEKRSTSCSSSADCPENSSCRDSDGNIVYIQEGPFGPIDLGGGEQGTCGASAGPGEICVRESECPEGYTCYQEMSGACCQPSKCVTDAYAQERNEYWSNCNPPTCYFPAK